MELHEHLPVEIGDELILEFNLNNNKTALTRETVRVKNINGLEIGAELKRKNEEKIKFTVTPKIRHEKNFIRLVMPQIIVMTLTLLGIVYGVIMYYLSYREDIVALLANTFWGFYNIIALGGLVTAALWKPESDG